MTSTWHYQHKYNLFRILQSLYTSKYGRFLGFKGGTALYFFYQLTRFSVDLDFNFTRSLSTADIQKMKSDLLSHLQTSLPDLTFKPDGTLQISIRYICQYAGEKTIKLEIASKMYDDIYEIKHISWLAVQVMTIEYMFAHKLCAFFSRQTHGKIANRDLFDMLFLFRLPAIPAPSIITQRSEKLFGTKLSTKEFYQKLLDFLATNDHMLQKNILDGLGDLLDDEQKKNTKTHLLPDLRQALCFARDRQTKT